MSNRVIKDSIRTNPKIASLTWFEEVLFYRLIVSADDYGCYDGRIAVVKNTLFPLKDNVTNKSVENALNKLIKVGLVYCYVVNDIPYLCVKSWDEHQRARNTQRRYPKPTKENSAASCGRLRQIAADCGRVEIKEEKEKVTQREKEEIYSSDREDNPYKEDIYISNKQESSYKEDKEYISTREDIPGKESIEEKKKSIANAILKEKKKIDPFVAFADGDAELLDAFAGFEEMRKQIKKPLTTRAKNLAISTLQKHGSTKQEWIAILNQSTLNCWQGLFPVDRDNAGNKGKKFEYNNHFEEWESL